MAHQHKALHQIGAPSGAVTCIAGPINWHSQTEADPTMTLKPPPITDVIEQMSEIVGPAGLAQSVDKNAKALLQSALQKLDFVSREEFDAQTAVLERTRAKVAALESELAAMTEMVEKLESGGN